MKAEKVIELARNITGLNLTFDEHGDIVKKLVETYGMTEQQARDLINALIAEGEAAKKAAEAQREHQRAVEQAEKALQSGVDALLNYGRATGPLTENINKVKDALATLAQEGVKTPSALTGFLNFITDLNNKLAELETKSKAIASAQSVVSVGMSYFNTLVAVNKGLVADQVQTLKTQIEELRRQEEELRRLLATNQSYEDQIKKQIEAVRQRREQLETELITIEQSTQLTAQQAASQEKLAGIQSVLSMVSQVLSLQQTALQLSMLGANTAANTFMNTSFLLADALSDGIITNEEYKQILEALGVTFNEQGKPVLNLKGIMESFKNTVGETRDKVEEFRQKLSELNGMTVHTYHYHHQIIIQETHGGGGSSNQAEITHQTEGRFFESYQRGAWFVPKTGPAFLHRGEMVIPADIAEKIRHGWGRSITVNINVSGVGIDAEELAQVISRKMVARLRML